MTDQDKERFEKIIRGLAENFNADVTAEGLRMRFEALKSFELEEVYKAAMAIMATRKYMSMPTIAEFLENLQGGSADDIAEVEARKVWNAMVDHGAHKSIVFDNPVTMAVVQQGFGGWVKMCADTKVDEMKWFIKDFVKTFTAFSRQGVTHYGQLPGIYPGAPVMIGNVEACQQVLVHKEVVNQLIDNVKLSSK